MKARTPAVLMIFVVLGMGPGRAQANTSKPTRVSGEPKSFTSGLQYWDIAVGSGAAAAPGQTIKVHYTAWLTNGTKFFSSVDRRKPFTFQLGAGQVIKGWDEGIAGMQVGGKRQLRIPPELGYGARGIPGAIPHNATLIYDVELLAVDNKTGDSDYVVGPQDIIDVSVWREPEVSRSVPVRPDGKISLPLLNDVQAAGLTPAQLTTQISTGLNKYMANPEVTVIVTQINSQRVYILGEVTRSGGYILLPGMTVLQAISNAGGLTLNANGKKIYVLRTNGAKQDKLFFNYNKVLGGQHTDQNVVLRSSDTVVVP